MSTRLLILLINAVLTFELDLAKDWSVSFKAEHKSFSCKSDVPLSAAKCYREQNRDGQLS